MKNVLKPLATSVWTPLGLTAVATATDASINNKMFVWQREEMKEI